MNAGAGQSVSRNVFILSIRQILTWSSTFLLLLFLPRYLGPVEYGKLYLGVSVVTMFALLIDFGGRYSITKEVSRAREDVGQIISDSIGIRALLWIVSFLAIIVFSYIARYDTTEKAILLIFGIAMTWSGIRSVLYSCYQGFEILEYPSYGVVAETIFIAAVGVPALLLGTGAVGFAVIMSLGWLLNFLICGKFAGHLTKSLPRINWHSAVALLKNGLPYFLNSLFGVIYYRIDSVMLSLMTPPSVVGWYGAAYRFFDALMFVPSIFTISIFPALARGWVNQQDSMGRRFQRSLDFIVLVGVPMSIGSFAFSDQVVTLLYGMAGYAPSVLLIKIFSVGLLLVYIDNIFGTTLLASDKQRIMSMNAFAAIFVNIALNYLFIPYTQAKFGNGGIGSAIATFATELFVMILMIFSLDKKILENSRIHVQLKALAAGCIMGITIWAFAAMGIPWIGQAILGSGVYCGLLYASNAVSNSDLRLVWELVPKRFRFARLGNEG